MRTRHDRPMTDDAALRARQMATSGVRSRWRHRLVVVPLAVGGLLVAGCAGSNTSAQSASPSGGVTQVRLVVKGSSVTGDTGTVAVRLGAPLQISVTSDVAEEVHVHGADISKDVEAGGTVVIDVTQKAPGRFEVELERSKRVLTRLQVS